MTTVETANGPIAASELGPTLMHEHVFVISTEVQQNYPEQWGDESARIDDAVDRLNELAAAGIGTIVDPTVLGLGRYIPRIAAIAERCAINIVVATGIYTFNELPHYYQRRPKPNDGPDRMTEQFVRDITVGIADTGIKSGVIKCATDRYGVTPDVDRALRACAQTHRQTGVPITTHTHALSRVGLDQQRIFAAEGVDLTRVVIGHCGDTEDLDYLEELLAAGSYLGMDRFGLDGYLPTPQRIATVAELCKRGYADQLVLSHDAACYIDWIEGETPVEHLPNWHYLHISNDVLPALREAGVSDDDLTTMLVDNPRRYFETTGLGGY